jgi:SAM-dependent methyltransferase
VSFPAREHFDWYADNSVQTYAEYERLPFWRALDKITFERWRQTIRPASRVLDIGCAQGRSTYQLADPSYETIGFDISKRLVRQAIERSGPGDRISFFVADATSLPFRPGSFDYALTYGVLHHLPDPARICREINGALKPGGTFFASENNRSALRAGFELLQRLRPIWHEEAGEFALISREQLRGWLEDAGFSVTMRTSVFLPPHLLNRVAQPRGERMLDWTDRVANAVPGLRGNGGLVVAEGVK